MKNNIKLSIIISVYNLQNYISKCIDSIVNQNIDFNNLEIIIIDDGSEDNSKKICCEYVKKYNFIKYVYQKNKGVSSARNKGLDCSNGKYVLMIDGDDVLLPNSLDIIFKNIEYNYDIMQSDFVKFFDKEPSSIKCKDNKNVNLINNSPYPLNIEYLFKSGLYNFSLAVNVIKREIIGKKRINENLKYTEDMDFLLDLLFESKRVYYINTPIYGYRQNRTGSATTKVNNKRVEDVLFFINKWEKFCNKNDLSFNSYLLTFLAYQLLIIMGISYYLNSKKVDMQIKKKLYLLINCKNYKVKVGYICYKIFGYKFTSFLMNKYLRIKSN